MRLTALLFFFPPPLRLGIIFLSYSFYVRLFIPVFLPFPCSSASLLPSVSPSLLAPPLPPTPSLPLASWLGSTVSRGQGDPKDVAGGRAVMSGRERGRARAGGCTGGRPLSIRPTPFAPNALTRPRLPGRPDVSLCFKGIFKGLIYLWGFGPNCEGGEEEEEGEIQTRG